MMTNLFSIFDPSNFLFNSSWMIPNLFILSPIFLLNSKTNKMFMYFFKKVWMEIFTMSKSSKSNWFIMSIFSLFLFANLMSMIPSNFTMTAQLATVLPIGLVMWLMTILYNSSYKMYNLISHLTPEDSPVILSPFLVLIELVSNIIRPITISVRLIANMTAGHLLMHLLSEFTCYIYPFSPMMIPVSLILTSLELMVCLIQAYIFCSLISMYSSEIH